MRETELNEVQRRVLVWIGAGCPDGTFEGYVHRVSAAALRTRGLVRTTGRGPAWSAELTDKGRRLLAGDPAVARTPKPRSGALAGVHSRERSRDDANEQQKTRAPTKTELLVRQLLASDGVLRLPVRLGRGGPTARQRAYAAQNSGKLPPGKRLTTQVVGTELEIRLVDDPRGERVVIDLDLVPVSVPEKVSRLHAAARQLRDLKSRHEVSLVELPRATRIVHAIAKEAERRGWSAEAPTETPNGYGQASWTGAKDGHLSIVVAGNHFGLRLQEGGVKTRGPWEKEVAQAKRYWSDYSWNGRTRIKPEGPHDAAANGRLKLTIIDGPHWLRNGRRSTFADGASSSLDSKLGELFRELELRVHEAELAEIERTAAAERAEEEAKRAAEERERQWHVLMADARRLHNESRRREYLRQQLDRWSEAGRVRDYAEALSAAHSLDSEVTAWIAWVRRYADSIDPLVEPPRVPADITPTHADLQKFLPEGWSTHGPRSPGTRRW